MFHFRHIEFLIALAALPVMIFLFYLLIKWKQKAIKKMGDPLLVKELIKGFSPRFFAIKFILMLLVFTLCAFAAADLVKPSGTEKINRKGIDVMIALDVSNSMLAEDIKPNRLERAKQLVSKIIDKLKDDKVGIVVFAGRAYLQMPLTTDHSAAKMYLSASSTENVPTQGTVISQALKMSYAAFDKKEKKYRSIIVISDGEDHDEEAVKVTKQLAEEGIMVNTIGIGSPQGAPIMDAETNENKKDENGNIVITKLNENALKDIAQNGNGIYQLFTSADVVSENVYRQLSGMGQSSYADNSSTIYKTYFWYFLMAAFIILIIENFISEKKSVIKLSKNAFAFIAFLLLANFAFSQTVKKEIIKGNEAYKKSQYDQAAASYKKVLANTPNNTAYYNLGNALYKNNKLDEALQAYDNGVRTAPNNTLKSRAYYNGGVTLQKQNKIQECIKAYKNTLKLNPDDEDARQNLQRALIRQKQQEKKEKKDKKDDKKDQDKKDDQQPKPQPSKISKQDAEEKLKSLLEHEKNLQDRLHKVKMASPEKPKKDW